ncbi:MAG TPA: carboxypeptidase-like regulatory domain-containing protein [Terriglobia bacterium]|nr:carboxypeptidase-like regulatory domain-containing protein [Terriglobia bacterium]
MSLLHTVASAQTTNATLGGTVSDATGALIPGVEVTAKNVGTGIVNTTLTNESGAYQFASLQTGTYEVMASLTGFQSATFNNVLLGGSQQVRLNFTLKVGDLTTTVEVSTQTDTTLATTSSSIGDVLPEAQVRELPQADRNVLTLLRAVGGGVGPTENAIEGYFAGSRISAVNVTRDGFSVSAGRYDQGTFATSYTSSDLVEEIKVETATVDAEATRGSGQVSMVTRSGTNQFRGSAFWNNRNHILDANNWFNNFNHTSSDWQNRNQFGVRLGGPIIKNKTFFFFLIDEQRFVDKENFVGTVLTDQARQGIFRYFPGVDARSALQLNATVDRNGNPILNGAPATPNSINLFSYDPNRAGYDPTGYMQKVILARMPSPNDFTIGDGLNTAGIRFTRRYEGLDVNTGETYDTNDRNQVNLRLDHNFNASNKASFVYTYENDFNNTLTAGIEQWPGGYNGKARKRPQIYSFSFVSTISANKVNELRIGYRGHDIAQWAPWYVARDRDKGGPTTSEAKEALSLLPQYNGIPMQVVPQIFGQGFMQFNSGFAATRGSWSPLLTYGDTISWNKGKHALKFGLEFRRDRSDGWNDNNFTPFATIGAGNFTAPIDNTVAGLNGLTSNNATNARNILYNLAGSIDNIKEGFDLRSSTNPQFLGYADGVKLKERDWHDNEVTAFAKDAWKVTSNLTLNVGLKWEYYGVPYEARGLAGRVVNGYQGLCGIACGALTTVELVGKNSPHPEKQLYNDYWKSFGPSIGFAYSIPGLGRSTIVRGGYGINFAGRQLDGVQQGGGLDSGGGTLPGLAGISGGNGLTYTQTAYWNLANVTLPLAPQFAPLSPVPLTDTRQLQMNMYDPTRRTPYIQNFNFSIQRELAKGLVLDVSYIGSKGTALYGLLEQNNVKMINNGFLNAFNITRSGGDAPLFDQMLNTINFPGIGIVGQGGLTGSQALRRYTNTRALLANGSAGGVAGFLNSTTNITGQGGGLFRGRLPEDFFVFNPQFAGAGINGNPTTSTYNSLEVQVTKRLSHGFTSQTNYTWSKSLGVSSNNDLVSTRDPNNRNLDHAALSYDRPHVISSSGTYELPFGKNRALLASGPGWLQRLAEQWQFGGLMRISSGSPLTISAGGLSNVTQTANNTVNIFGPMPEGKVTKFTNGSLPSYFTGLVQKTDPGVAGVTSANTLSTAYTNKAIYDANGNLLFANPAPGSVGSLGIGVVRGPRRFELDANLLKRVRVTETKSFEFRADVVNILNHPIFANPDTNINSATFGLINATAGDGRRFTLGARLNF